MLLFCNDIACFSHTGNLDLITHTHIHTHVHNIVYNCCCLYMKFLPGLMCLNIRPSDGSSVMEGCGTSRG